MRGAATQRYSHEFIAVLERLPSATRTTVQEKIDGMGLRLDHFDPYRMTRQNRDRLRVDYRIIYRFDNALNIIDLITLGHRREVYRE